MGIIPSLVRIPLTLALLALSAACLFPPSTSLIILFPCAILSVAWLIHTVYTIRKDDGQLGLDVPPRVGSGGYAVLYAHGNGTWPGVGTIFSHSKSVITMDMETTGIRGPTSESWYEWLCTTLIQYNFFQFRLFGGSLYAVRIASKWLDMNLGGERDAILYARAVSHLISTLPTDRRIVLFGTSMGGATVYNALTILAQTEGWEKWIRPRIACVILFAPFDSVETVIKFRFYEYVQRMHKYILSYTAYDPSWNPIERVSIFPSGLNVLFVSSASDNVVPFHSTMNPYVRTCEVLADKAMNAPVREQGQHVPAKILTLKNVEHDFNFAAGKDRRDLVDAVHGLLKASLAKDIH